jgi:CRISPR/Cas system CSM-associated protein Csm3 (group 7 of RAMP superfamily)
MEYCSTIFEQDCFRLGGLAMSSIINLGFLRYWIESYGGSGKIRFRNKSTESRSTNDQGTGTQNQTTEDEKVCNFEKPKRKA